MMTACSPQFFWVLSWLVIHVSMRLLVMVVVVLVVVMVVVMLKKPFFFLVSRDDRVSCQPPAAVERNEIP